MRRAISVLTILACIGCASDGKPAQPAAAAIVYRDVGFSGPAVYIENPRPDLDFAFGITSIRIKSGTWLVCSGRNYSGTCRTLSSDVSNLSSLGLYNNVKSLRPADRIIKPR